MVIWLIKVVSASLLYNKVSLFCFFNFLQLISIWKCSETLYIISMFIKLLIYSFISVWIHESLFYPLLTILMLRSFLRFSSNWLSHEEGFKCSPIFFLVLPYIRLNKLSQIYSLPVPVPESATSLKPLGL